MWLNEVMLWNIVWGVVLISILVLSSGMAVDAFEKLASRIRTSKLLLATLLISFSTSLPELSVGLASSFKGQPQIALGNIIGSNLANLSWIIGGSAIVAGVIPIVGEYLKRDLWATIGMAMMPFLLMTDGNLSRADGIFLMVLYGLYVKWVMGGEGAREKHNKVNKSKVVHHHLQTKMHWIIWMGMLVVSLVMMALSSKWLINIALGIAAGFGVNAFWVGLLMISFGTTLPEMVLSLAASKRGDISLLLGNILGSVVFNSTFILGIIAVINPVTFEETVQKGIAGIFLIIILGFFWLFTKSKKKLERWEGLVLVGMYLMFVGLQFMFA